MTENETPTYETVLVRTKTGAKLHIGSSGSSRTVCGARAAMRAKYVPQHATFCAACGVDPTATAGEVAQRFNLAVR